MWLDTEFKYKIKYEFKEKRKRLKICVKCGILEYHYMKEKYCRECAKNYLDKLKRKVWY